MKISVVLADDQAMVRAGFRLILEAEDDLEIAGEASEGEEAVAVTRRLQPDVVLMDIQMPKLDGLEATRRICTNTAVRSHVVILTTFGHDEYVFEALRAGASGFLLKNGPPEALVRAVRTVAAGDALLSPSIRGATAAGNRQEQRRARWRALPRRGHDQDTRLPRARQARAPRPRPSRRLCLRERPHRTASKLMCCGSPDGGRPKTEWPSPASPSHQCRRLSWPAPGQAAPRYGPAKGQYPGRTCGPDLALSFFQYSTRPTYTN